MPKQTKPPHSPAARGSPPPEMSPFERDLLASVQQALRGEEVVIARNGVPAVKLVQVKDLLKKLQTTRCH